MSTKRDAFTVPNDDPSRAPIPDEPIDPGQVLVGAGLGERDDGTPCVRIMMLGWDEDDPGRKVVINAALSDDLARQLAEKIQATLRTIRSVRRPFGRVN
ncbi:MAG: hypothetical protein JO157_10775 [Acetobacteraceae bacterium]|nr:hypothetical protein [Acetobacteraceae bacterium]